MAQLHDCGRHRKSTSHLELLLKSLLAGGSALYSGAIYLIVSEITRILRSLQNFFIVVVF
jgi:hypothetical protein